MPRQEAPGPARSLRYEDRHLADYRYTTAWHPPHRGWIFQVGPLRPHLSFMLYLYHRLMHHTTRRTTAHSAKTGCIGINCSKYMPSI